jgi:hypothetical protein
MQNAKWNQVIFSKSDTYQYTCYIPHITIMYHNYHEIFSLPTATAILQVETNRKLCETIPFNMILLSTPSLLLCCVTYNIHRLRTHSDLRGIGVEVWRFCRD